MSLETLFVNSLCVWCKVQSSNDVSIMLVTTFQLLCSSAFAKKRVDKSSPPRQSATFQIDPIMSRNKAFGQWRQLQGNTRWQRIMVVCEIARQPRSGTRNSFKSRFLHTILSSVSVGQLPAVPSFFTSLQTFLWLNTVLICVVYYHVYVCGEKLCFRLIIQWKNIIL